jgi:hypothetical protein
MSRQPPRQVSLIVRRQGDQQHPMKFVEWLNYRVAPWIAAIGVTPRTVTLEVRGRRSGRPIRLALSPARLEGQQYLVSLAGERHWVLNVRAAHGEAFILHGRRIPVHLEKVPVEHRAPILRAYIGERAFTRSPRRAARLYFGLETPTLEDMKRLAPRYPVFRAAYDISEDLLGWSDEHHLQELAVRAFERACLLGCETAKADTFLTYHDFERAICP